jgi:hypothetical protein
LMRSSMKKWTKKSNIILLRKKKKP